MSPKRSGKAIILFLIVYTTACILDQSRNTAYNYMFAMAILAMFPAREGKSQDVAWHAFQMIMVGIYFWSGLHKLIYSFWPPSLNFLFVDNVIPSTIGAVIDLPQDWHNSPWRWAAFSLAFIEMALAVGLCFRSTRKVSVILLICMHLLISLALSPIFLNWNVVVIPWNLAMIAWLLIFFWNREEGITKQWLNFKRSFILNLMILLFWFAPLLNLFYQWDAYMSASLYSGKTYQAALFLEEEEINKLPVDIQTYFEESERGRYIQFAKWSMAERRSLPYPEIRAYKVMHKNICKKYDLEYDPDDLQIYQ